MTTTLLFLTSSSMPRGGEQDFHSALENAVVTEQLALECGRATINQTAACRIGILEVCNGQVVKKPGWRIQRYQKFEDMPAGAFFELMPAKVGDIVDDMDVLINLPPFVAVLRD